MKKNNLKYKVSFELELKRNPYKGCYIALEGTDGSGKTTQVEELANYYRTKGNDVVTTREPRKEGIIGDLVHQVLLGEEKFPSLALQYLFTTDRVLNHEQVIKPALEKGAIVISDRCFWSGIVYGVLDRMKENYDTKSTDYLLIAHSILSFYHQFIIPDFTFYLKIPLDVSLGRIANERKQAKEIYEDEDQIKKVIQGYDELFTRFKQEIITVDGTRPIKEVTDAMALQIGDRI